jgi:hypothetical protein
MLKDHWLVLRCLRGARICEMTANQAPWTGTVTAPSLPSPLEVQRRVTEAIGRSTYLWPPSRLLPMLPSEGTKKFVSCYLLDASCVLLVVMSVFSEAFCSG